MCDAHPALSSSPTDGAMRKIHFLGLFLIVAMVLAGCNLPTASSGQTAAASSSPIAVPPTTTMPLPSPSPTITPTRVPLPTLPPTPTLTPTPSLTQTCQVEDSRHTISVQLPCLWKDMGNVYHSLRREKNYQFAGMAFLIAAPDLQAFEKAQSPGVIIGASKDAAKWYGYKQLLAMTFSWLPKGYQGYSLYSEEDTETRYQDTRFRGGYKWSYFAKPSQILTPTGQVWVYVLRPNTSAFVPGYMVGILMVKTNDIPDSTWDTIMETMLKTLTISPSQLP